MKLSLAEIAQITNGRICGQVDDELESKVIDGLSTDTRTLQAGNLFVVLRGEKFDAHEFVEQGDAKQATAVLLEREVKTSCIQIVVQDTYVALQQLAVAWRKKFTIPVIGITGSNGKTSVKEFIKAILSTQGEVLATLGNLNNHIGVPLTLARLNAGHNFAVIEMGANHAGEIATLTRLVDPHLGVITNIGPAHLEGFGSLQGVAAAKAELYENLNPQGIAVVNADEPYVDSWQQAIAEKMQLSFALEKNADVRGKQIDLSLAEITTPVGDFRVELQILGQHALYNALAATAVCVGLGVDLEDIKQGLESTKPVPGRLVRLKGIADSRILDDSYNANPASLFAALDAQRQEPGERWLVLGDMGELGDDSISLHEKAGILAKEYGISRLFAVGDLSANAVKTFGAGATHFVSHAELIEKLQSELYKEICVLVKGSRAMQLEQVVKAIRMHENPEALVNEHVA